MNRDNTLSSWVTLLERSHDKRTGAVVEVCVSGEEYWAWTVLHASGPKSGEALSRISARAAARRYVRTLDAKPDRQLDLFSP